MSSCSSCANGGMGATNPSVLQSLQVTLAQQSKGASDEVQGAAQGGPPAAGGHGHHHHHRGGGLLGRIESAVTSALQSSQADGGADDTDQVIQDAIVAALQGGGSDPAPATGSGAPASAPQLGGAEGGRSGSGLQGFLQSLQAQGVDPRQFFAEFKAAQDRIRQGKEPAAAPTTSAGAALDVTA